MKEGERQEAFSGYWVIIDAYKILARKSEWKRPLARPRHTPEFYIKITVKEIVSSGELLLIRYLFDSIKGWKYLYQLTDYQFLKDYPVLWSDGNIFIHTKPYSVKRAMLKVVLFR
jgi:hypothetical protein